VINNVAFERYIVKSEYATIEIPDAGLEIPASTFKGTVMTLKGYISATIKGLENMKEEETDPATISKIEKHCEELK